MEKCTTEKWLIQQMWNMSREIIHQSFSPSAVEYLRRCQENYRFELKRFREKKSLYASKMVCLENDLRNYFNACRDYDGSVAAANGRENCLRALYGSIPWGIKTNDFIDMLVKRPTYNTNVAVAFCMNWCIDRLYNTIPAPRIF